MSSVSEIRSWFEVPAIAHYCYLFRAAFDLTEFEIEDLEDSLLIDGASEGYETSFLPDLLARLLRGLYRTKDIASHSYERYLNDLLDYHYTFLESRENPVKDIEFRKLPCRTKVTILYDVCHWRLEVDDIQELLKGREPDELRVQSIGTDSKGDKYWYFYGTRLYKETFIERENIILNGNVNYSNGKSKKNKHVGKYLHQRIRRKKRKDSTDSESSSAESESQDSLSTSEHCQPVSKNTKTKWSLQCSTADDWSEFVDSLKDSENEDEQVLYQTLSENYLENMIEAIDAKEKAAQKKLLVDNLPRRASGRIAMKMNDREEEEKTLEAIRQLEEEERAREAEEKRKEMEERKKMERENRLRERERIAEERRIEREKRLKNREEQKWALENPELATQFKETLKTSELDEGQSSSSKYKVDGNDKDEDEYTAMYKVINALKKHKDVWPFLEPVDESYAPQYFEIIKNPMDLSTIEKKLDQSEYTDREKLSQDVKLMLSNCLAYNGEESPYTKMANNLERAYDKYFAKEFPKFEENSDEDYVDEDENPRKRKRQRNERNLEKVARLTDNMNGDSGSSASKQDNQPKTQTEISPIGILPRLSNGSGSGVRPMLRFGNASIPTDLYSARIIQQYQQNQRAGLQQLINSMNRPMNAGNQMALAPRMAFVNRPNVQPNLQPNLQANVQGNVQPNQQLNARPGVSSSAAASSVFFNGLVAASTVTSSNSEPLGNAKSSASTNPAFNIQQMLRSPFVTNNASNPNQLLLQLAKQQQLSNQQQQQLSNQQQQQQLSKQQLSKQQQQLSIQQLQQLAKQQQLSNQQQQRISNQQLASQQQQQLSKQKLPQQPSNQQQFAQQQQQNFLQQQQQLSQQQQQQLSQQQQQQLLQQTAQLHQHLQQRMQLQQQNQIKTSNPIWPIMQKQLSSSGIIFNANVQASCVTTNTLEQKTSVAGVKASPAVSSSVKKSKAAQKKQNSKNNEPEASANEDDPMSDANRNKKISLEESNQRVRNWLNSQTSYFEPVEDDSSQAKSGKLVNTANASELLRNANAKTSSACSPTSTSLQIPEQTNSAVKSLNLPTSNSQNQDKFRAVSPRFVMQTSQNSSGKFPIMQSSLPESSANQKIPALSGVGMPAFLTSKTNVPSLNKIEETSSVKNTNSIMSVSSISGNVSNKFERPSELNLSVSNKSEFLFDNLFASTGSNTTNKPASLPADSLAQLQQSILSHQGKEQLIRQFNDVKAMQDKQSDLLSSKNSHEKKASPQELRERTPTPTKLQSDIMVDENSTKPHEIKREEQMLSPEFKYLQNPHQKQQPLQKQQVQQQQQKQALQQQQQQFLIQRQQQQFQQQQQQYQMKLQNKQQKQIGPPFQTLALINSNGAQEKGSQQQQQQQYQQLMQQQQPSFTRSPIQTSSSPSGSNSLSQQQQLMLNQHHQRNLSKSPFFIPSSQSGQGVNKKIEKQQRGSPISAPQSTKAAQDQIFNNTGSDVKSIKTTRMSPEERSSNMPPLRLSSSMPQLGLPLPQTFLNPKLQNGIGVKRSMSSSPVPPLLIPAQTAANNAINSGTPQSLASNQFGNNRNNGEDVSSNIDFNSALGILRPSGMSLNQTPLAVSQTVSNANQLNQMQQQQLKQKIMEQQQRFMFANAFRAHQNAAPPALKREQQPMQNSKR